MIKKIIIIVLALLLLNLSFSFAGGKAETKAKPELAVLLPGSVEFFSVMQKGMNKAAEKYDLKLTYGDAEWDAGKQLSQVENFVTKGVDAVLLCAGDNQALLPAVKICQDADIPLITFTNTLGSNPDGWVDGIVTFIGTNEVSLGRKLGEMSEELVGDKAVNIVLIEGAPGTAPQRMRTKGFKEVVAKHSGWKIVYSQAIPGWTKEGSLAAMEAFLQTGKEVDLVVTHWNAAAAAAAMAIKEAGYKKKVYIVGLEFNKDLVNDIKEGAVDKVTYYSVEDTGYTIIESAAKYLNGQTLAKFIEIDVQTVDKGNVDSIVPEF